jgi:hypothetical protein
MTALISAMRQMIFVQVLLLLKEFLSLHSGNRDPYSPSIFSGQLYIEVRAELDNLAFPNVLKKRDEVDR